MSIQAVSSFQTEFIRRQKQTLHFTYLYMDIGQQVNSTRDDCLI